MSLTSRRGSPSTFSRARGVQPLSAVTDLVQPCGSMRRTGVHEVKCSCHAQAAPMCCRKNTFCESLDLLQDRIGGRNPSERRRVSVVALHEELDLLAQSTHAREGVSAPAR